ncbi:MAG: YtxH domain-containing protein [Verrucomicrobia bacterium]|nr:YtxH domain-containing protein [Verrucomicrobiota bacterium]
MILRLFVGIVVGGALGFALYKFVGCSTGACPLTSHPVAATLYGAVLGALIAGSLR